jgi:hypothetical protein
MEGSTTFSSAGTPGLRQIGRTDQPPDLEPTSAAAPDGVFKAVLVLPGLYGGCGGGCRAALHCQPLPASPRAVRSDAPRLSVCLSVRAFARLSLPRQPAAAFAVPPFPTRTTWSDEHTDGRT